MCLRPSILWRAALVRAREAPRNRPAAGYRRGVATAVSGHRLRSRVSASRAGSLWEARRSTAVDFRSPAVDPDTADEWGNRGTRADSADKSWHPTPSTLD